MYWSKHFAYPQGQVKKIGMAQILNVILSPLSSVTQLLKSVSIPLAGIASRSSVQCVAGRIISLNVIPNEESRNRWSSPTSPLVLSEASAMQAPESSLTSTALSNDAWDGQQATSLVWPSSMSPDSSDDGSFDSVVTLSSPVSDAFPASGPAVSHLSLLAMLDREVFFLPAKLPVEKLLMSGLHLLMTTKSNSRRRNTKTAQMTRTTGGKSSESVPSVCFNDAFAKQQMSMRTVSITAREPESDGERFIFKGVVDTRYVPE